MNTKGDLCLSRHFLPAIALHLTQQKWMQSFTFQNFEVIGLLGENLDFLAHWEFYVQRNSDHKGQKIKPTQSEL